MSSPTQSRNTTRKFDRLITKPMINGKIVNTRRATSAGARKAYARMASLRFRLAPCRRGANLASELIVSKNSFPVSDWSVWNHNRNDYHVSVKRPNYPAAVDSVVVRNSCSVPNLLEPPGFIPAKFKAVQFGFEVIIRLAILYNSNVRVFSRLSHEIAYYHVHSEDITNSESNSNGAGSLDVSCATIGIYPNNSGWVGCQCLCCGYGPRDGAQSGIFATRGCGTNHMCGTEQRPV